MFAGLKERPFLSSAVWLGCAVMGTFVRGDIDDPKETIQLAISELYLRFSKRGKALDNPEHPWDRPDLKWAGVCMGDEYAQVPSRLPS
jgi:hypothetical protein